MTASVPADHQHLFEAARGFRHYLIDQTGIALPELGVVSASHDPVALQTAFDLLDHALAQLADLASVYSDTPQASLEPLVAPTTALAGEYLCQYLGARWQVAEDDTTILVGERTLPLHDIVRATVLSGGQLRNWLR